jgi:putative SOS response-associated peptidase YedK
MMTVPMVHRTAGSLDLVPARWELVPFWWKEAKPTRCTFNARSEDAATKAAWRHLAGNSRCLVPALGWYEWKEVEQIDPATGEARTAKQSYFMQRSDREPIAFAGLMSRRILEGGMLEYACTILTRAAVGVVSEIHERMPIALPKDAEAAWLDPRMTDAATAVGFARDNAITDLVLHPVNPRVINSGNEGAEPTSPFENPA